MDITPPIITLTTPGKNATSSQLSDPIEISFNKVMSSNSLISGFSQIQDKRNGGYITHYNINIWDTSNNPLGYWVNKENLENGTPDGEPDYTKALIKHTMFGDLKRFRAQVGSGVRDIYQNCYLPAVGPACSGVSQSCCNGTNTASSTCP
jgi:hypothetical protein